MRHCGERDGTHQVLGITTVDSGRKDELLVKSRIIGMPLHGETETLEECCHILQVPAVNGFCAFLGVGLKLQQSHIADESLEHLPDMGMAEVEGLDSRFRTREGRFFCQFADERRIVGEPVKFSQQRQVELVSLRIGIAFFPIVDHQFIVVLDFRHSLEERGIGHVVSEPLNLSESPSQKVFLDEPSCFVYDSSIHFQQV